MIVGNYFSSYLEEISERTARSTLGIFGIKNRPLRKYLNEQFLQKPGDDGAYIGDPVFEATFGWSFHDQKMNNLSGNLLNARLVSAMDCPPKELTEYRFDSNWCPYEHQHKSWSLLTEETPKSVVVTSGTGSGKTECFLIPVLDDLAAQVEGNDKELEGVQALFLYPLNALINSQKDRLKAWTSGFENQIKYCLFNGNTDRNASAAAKAAALPEVIDRKTIRKSPPPILVTNSTMLEYMLVRQEDAPIIAKSKGMLRWIILDEAHTYQGSNAAELSLLLRRVMYAFGVSPSDVRFVATSATIGEESDEELQNFLADLAGINVSQVHVVGGTREVPDIIENKDLLINDLTVDEMLQSSDTDSLVCCNKSAIALRRYIAESGAQPLSKISDFMDGNTDRASVLEWLDLLSSTTYGDQAFLPMRMHVFHRVTPGIWVCPDARCRARTGTSLDNEEWLFGKVYLSQQDHCECGAPVFDYVGCDDCGEHYLLCDITPDHILEQKIWNFEDEFRLLDFNSENGDEEELEEEIEAENENETIVISNKHYFNSGGEPQTQQIQFNKETGELILDGKGQTEIIARQFESFSGGCICCGIQVRTKLRRKILGAPFHLSSIIPKTLEFCPESSSPLDAPHRGQRLITFTDSRQGTARLAAKMHQDSERNLLRSLVYNQLLYAEHGQESPEVKSYRDQINLLEELQEATGGDRTVQIDLLKSKISESESTKILDLPKVVTDLGSQDDIRKWLQIYYRRWGIDAFANRGTNDIAEMLLTREFSRRPKRHNSMETMGLVSVEYPKLRNIDAAPTFWKDRGKKLSEWKIFLKIILDFHVRGNTFIDLPDDWARWSGNRFFAKTLIPPNSPDSPSTMAKRWPQATGASARSRIPLLLSRLLGLNLESERDKNICNELLTCAWEDLTRVQVLMANSSNQYRLMRKEMGFALIRKAQICPLTGRFLDVTLGDITPWMTSRTPLESTICNQSIDIPVFQLTPGKSYHEQKALAYEWLSKNETVKHLREEGFWNDLHDRIVAGIQYFRIEEHSAQQSGEKLAEYEAAFKKEKINILSCSTTMEMGVDIGGISTVLMSNVPPHPANYRQRAGRAARQNEAQSLVVTLCKNDTHDQRIFKQTDWAFVTPPPIPYVSLNSKPIVQRHINSFLLGNFFNSELKAESFNLEAATFFASEEETLSLAEQFMCFCDTVTDALSLEEKLRAGFKSILKGTILENDADSDIIDTTKNSIRVLSKKWNVEHLALKNQLAEIETAMGDNDPAAKATRFQLQRFEREYLLSALAEHAFLPGYGFPLHIVEFNNFDVSQFKKKKRHEQRNESRQSRSDFPSRDCGVAIREYAPGANVVVDGKVYKSQGIAMTWKAPVSAETSEIQDIRVAWRCQACGDSGTSRIRDQFLLECKSCCANVDRLEVKEFLTPSGFSVDFYDDPHNDVSSQTYIPVSEPWVSVETNWRNLSKPELGDVRVSRDSQVFLHSSGEHGAGYSLCLGCGRAHAQIEERQRAQEFARPHRRLRYGESKHCASSENSFLIKQDIHLGYQFTTDSAELRLYDDLSNPLTKNAQGECLLSSLSVAFQFGLSRVVGVEASEIKCLLVPRKQENIRFDVILLLDTASGGAGYCSQLADRFSDVVEAAVRQLDCPSKCDSACSSCLISKDHNVPVKNLNRHLARDYILENFQNVYVSESVQAIPSRTGLNKKTAIRPYNNNLSDFKHLQIFLKKISDGVKSEGNIILNLPEKIFLKPFSLLYLGLFIRSINDDSPNAIQFSSDTNKGNYIDFMGFWDLCGVAGGAAMGQDNLRGDFSYIRIQCKEIEDVSLDDDEVHAREVEKMQKIGEELAQSLLQENQGGGKDQDITTLAFLCREILRNVVEHSYSDNLYYCAQYYPKEDKVEIAIADLGEGILQSLRSTPKESNIENDLEAIKLALSAGISGRAHKYSGRRAESHYYANSGYGLYMADRICSENGSLKISSYSATVIHDGDIRDTYTGVEFPGTILGLELKLGKVGDISEKLRFIRASLDQKIKEGRRVPSRASTSLKPD